MKANSISRLAVAAVAVGALGILGVAHPGTAGAERVWDIEEYDNCSASLDEGLDNTQHWIDTVAEYCCKHSGGDWQEYPGKCVAPPAESKDSGAPVPPRPLRPLGPVAGAYQAGF